MRTSSLLPMVAVCLLLVPACGSTPAPAPSPETGCTDRDRDTFAAEGGRCGTADCDDGDPAVNPGVDEGFPGGAACGDGVDNDCDGLSDDLDPGCRQPAGCTSDADCSDGDPCTEDECVETTHGCASTCNAAGPHSACCGSSPVCAEAAVCQGDCASDADCSDGLFCNGAERCVSRSCVPGTPVTCNDSNGCTDDVCVEASRSCANTCNALYAGEVCCGNPACDTAPACAIQCLADGHCDDGAFCNGVESCAGSACQSGAAPCDDADPCTTDTCSEAEDTCTSQCGAAGPQDACCNAPACEESPACSGEPFAGGSFRFRVTGIGQAPGGAAGGCLLEPSLLNLVVPLISDAPFTVELPAQAPEPVALDLPLPFLGNLHLAAAFAGNALRFAEQDVDGMDLGRVPAAGLFGLNCVVGGRASGAISPLDGGLLPATLEIRDLTVEAGLPSHGSCSLETPDPSCTLTITLEGS